MRFKIAGFLCFLAALTAATGCLEQRFAEPDTSISLKTSSLTVPSDSPLGRNLVTGTAWVSANRSWSAIFTEEVDWVKMDTCGHLNLDRVTEDAPLVFLFKDNESDSPRTAHVRIFSEAGTGDITITQESISYRLELLSEPESFLNLTNEAGSCKLAFSTNTEWSVCMKEGSSISATFSKASGKYSDEITVEYAENETTSDQSGTLVLSANGCDPIEIQMTQKKGKPYLRFPDGQDVFSAEDGMPNFVIPVITNSNWSASIVSVEGYKMEDVSTSASGDKTVRNAEIIFPAAVDFSVKQTTIKVKFTVDGLDEPVYAFIHQTPCVRLIFGNPANPAFHSNQDVMYNASDAAEVAIVRSYWPFILCEEQSGSGWISHDDGFDWLASTRAKKIALRFTTKGGYLMNVYSEGGAIRKPDYGLGLGKALADYFGCPIVPGHRLVKIDYWHHGSGVDLQLKDASGVEVSGASIKIKNASADHHVVLENITGTEPGVEYRLCPVASWNLRIGDVIFYYE